MRNRYYDPNTGTFTQADPVGLAGGLNLYGYAGNNPIMFTDPFGLKVDTTDAKAGALWRQALSLASNACKSKNKDIGGEGIALGRVLNAISSSDRTVTISVKSIGPIMGAYTGGAYTQAVYGGSDVVIDPTRASARFGIGNELVMIHELGHALFELASSSDQTSNQLAVTVENMGRTILGCVQRSEERRVGKECP